MPELLKKNKKFNHEMLYHRRVSLGFNTADIAKKTGVSKTAVWQWEGGKCGPSPKALIKLAKMLKVEPNYFFAIN